MTLYGQQTRRQSISLCEIIRENSYEESLREFPREFARMDEFESAIDWALARDPELGYNHTEDYYTWRTDGIKNFPTVRIIYTYNSEIKQVHLVLIEEVTSDL